MTCSCGGCISRSVICVPRGNDKTLIFSVRDTSGDEFDISGASEIVFIVSDGVVTGGNIGPGGSVRIVKKLSDSDIQISTNLYQFYFTITAAESDALPRTRLYYEAEVTTSLGMKYTVSAGEFRSDDTQIRSLP